MEGKRLIEKIKLRNILSFGDKGEEITLEPLNIIIGQNASGKSNLVDVIKLLRSLPQDKGLVNFISKSGGVDEWLWKGKKNFGAEIKVTFGQNEEAHSFYELDFTESSQRLVVTSDTLTNIKTNEIIAQGLPFGDDTLFTQKYQEVIKSRKYAAFQATKPQLSGLTFYTDLQTNRGAEIRKLQLADLPNDFLDEDASNLSLVLNDLDFKGNVKEKIVENLKKFNPRITDYKIRVLGGTLQLNIYEQGLDKPISAMRLSDGTLRYLCLLAILCHPEPPPLICIEEPETGLHPDILPTIAELMIEASQRMQLIVTTHSDILVSAFSEIPEAVLVCEKDEDGTHFKRLEADKLKVWLEEYTLGEVWMRGGIGGTRW